MAGLATVLSWAVSRLGASNAYDVKSDPGGGANVTASHYADPGDDSQALPGDTLVHVPGPGSGTSSAVGYLDPKPENRTAGPGEKRIYGRSPNGAAVCEIICKNDGTIEIASLIGAVIKLGPVEIDASGNITTPGDVIAGTGNQKHTLLTHTHGYLDSVGAPPVPTPATTAQTGQAAVGP